MPSFFMQKQEQKHTLFFITALSAFVILIYWPGLNGPFLLDDLQTLAAAKMSTFSFSKLFEISFQNQTGPLGRPLSVATFALNDWLFGFNPFYFKIINLVIHLLTGFSIGYFVYRLISSKAVAWITMILWLIHPLQVSTVLYIVQRMTQLGTLFLILGLSAYLCGRRRQLAQQSSNGWFILSFFVFFPLSIFSKEIGLLFPWFLLIIEYFFLRFECPTASQSRLLLRFHQILSLGLLFGALGYFYWKFDYFLSVYGDKGFSLATRLLTESKALLFYLSLIFRPVLASMGLYHDDFTIAAWTDPFTWLSLGFLALMVFVIFYARRRATVLSFGLAWFLISHAIESTVLPLELVFEHRNYLGMVGLLLIPSYYGMALYEKMRRPIQIWFMVLFAILILGLSLLTFVRSSAWSNPARFLNDAYRHHPHSPRVHIELGNWYLIQKQYALAHQELDIALDLQPKNVGLLLHKILIGCHTRVVNDSLYQDATKDIQKAPITPYVIMVLNQMLNNMVSGQCATLPPSKIELIIQSALQNPSLKYKPKYKAVLYQLEAGLPFMQGDINRCTELLMKSFEADPSRLDPLIQKALIEWQHHRATDAKATLVLIKKHAHFIKAPHTDIQYLEDLFKRANP